VKTPAVELAPLAAADAAEIRVWPPYPPPFEPLDYALRAGGWLDQFPASAANRRLAVRSAGILVGFTLLVDLRAGDAEFYLAVHPAHLNRGVGRAATLATVALGFASLGLARIHLKVREWHAVGIRLYREVGFIPGETMTLEVAGRQTAFLAMALTREAFAARSGSR